MQISLLLISISALFVSAYIANSIDFHLNHAYRLLNGTPLIDGHNDLPMLIRDGYSNHVSSVPLSSGIPRGHTDIPRLRQGHVGGQFWSIYVPCQQLTSTSSSRYSTAVRDAMEQIDTTLRMIQHFPHDFSLALSPAHVRTSFNRGRVASMLGMEGSHMLGDGSLSLLRLYFQLGIRYLTLTHTCHTAFADSANQLPPLHGGLNKPYGTDLIRELNRLGMLVDLAHVSHPTMHDVLSISRAPVIFSHSSAYTLCPIPRNVPDTVLAKLKEKDGVVMVNFYSGFVRCDGQRGTLADVADHIEHIARVAGHEHVGLGADYDGVPTLPVGLEDVSRYPYLMAELLRRGWTDQQVRGVAGENLLRVWEKVERVAQEMQRTSAWEVERDVHLNKTCGSGYDLKLVVQI